MNKFVSQAESWKFGSCSKTVGGADVPGTLTTTPFTSQIKILLLLASPWGFSLVSHNTIAAGGVTMKMAMAGRPAGARSQVLRGR